MKLENAKKGSDSGDILKLLYNVGFKKRVDLIFIFVKEGYNILSALLNILSKLVLYPMSLISNTMEFCCFAIVNLIFFFLCL